MPALSSFTRLMQVLPAGSPAYTQIYRLCSTNNASPSTPPAGSGVGGSGAAPTHPSRTSPKSLDLGLNFATMDFDAVAKATHAAMVRERGIGGAATSTQRDNDFEAKLERQSEQSSSRRATPPPPTTASPVPQPSPNASFHATSHSRPSPGSAGRASSGSGGFGASSATPGSGFAREGTRPRPPRRDSGGNTRYSLHDLLKDCVMEGNWAKAFQMFSNAVNQSCRQVLIPGVATAAGGATTTDAASSSSCAAAGQHVDPAREAECLAAVQKMMAALPPVTANDRPAAVARRVNVSNMRGIVRWNGQHYYLLWKCLLEAGRLEEVQRVWSVMQQIGFVDCQMEEKTVNMLMVLLRRSSIAAEKAATQLVSTAFSHTESFDERVEREKEIRRELVKELEQVATARKFHLVSSNRRTAEGIRIEEALRRVDSADQADSDAEAEGATRSPPAPASAGTPFADSEASVIAVGDFSGLLRRSRSMESTHRVLQMMAKLSLEMESATFASLIASLHNPQYVLEGHTAEELSSHVAATPTATTNATPAGESAEGRVGEESASTAAEKEGAAIDTKTQYEAYKQERVETALRWFFQCPKPRRTAEVYNELLYLLRSKSHWRDFDKVLVELRGNAVVSEEEWPEAVAAAARAPVAAPDGTATVTPVILAPQWSTPPNGKTYELIIQRARYVHQWDVMWALYEEMASCRVRGTTRLYEVLLAEVSYHPPQVLHGVEVGSDASKESSEVLMRLYDELRRNGGDVRSFKSTMHVVNAWSKSRAKMNRWE